MWNSSLITRYAIVVLGVGNVDQSDMLHISDSIPHRVVKLRDLGELVPGKSAHKILVDLVNNPDFSKYIFI